MLEASPFIVINFARGLRGLSQIFPHFLPADFADYADVSESFKVPSCLRMTASAPIYLEKSNLDSENIRKNCKYLCNLWAKNVVGVATLKHQQLQVY